MTKLALGLCLCLLAACRSSPAANCAVAPPGFHDPRSPDTWAVAIVPPDVNTISVERSGRITWNGVDVETHHGPMAVIDTYLSQVALLNPRPYTALDFEAGAPCASIERVRALMERHLDCQNSQDCLQGNPAA